MKKYLRRGLWGFALLAWSTVASAASIQEDTEMLEALRHADVRLATVAFRLATLAGSLCIKKQQLSGLIVHDAAMYDPALRTAVNATFDLNGGAGVEGVVPGSPADRAGLRANDQLTLIDGNAVETSEGFRKADFSSENLLLDRLETALVDGQATLGTVRAGAKQGFTLKGLAGCASRVQLVPGGSHDAWADGRVITLSTAIFGDAIGDDELAFLVAHEMSHNILGHRARLDEAGVGNGLFSTFGKNARAIRKTEEEADYLALYLMARAGYDPAAAAVFWQRFGHAHGFGIFADSTHLNGGARVRFLRIGAEEIVRKRAAKVEIAPDMASVPALEAEAQSHNRKSKPIQAVAANG